MKIWKDLIEIAVYLAITVAIVGGVYFMEKYRYDDCRKVGHTFLYCLFDIGK